MAGNFRWRQDVPEGVRKAGLVILLLAVSYVLAITLFPPPKIGVITLDTAITTGSADAMVDMLNYAQEDRAIKGVVLKINSPGGEVTATEETYLRVLELRKDKPVVASIDQVGASGAYYVAVASNAILAKPSSSVGSVGVISSMPEAETLDEETLTTGPFKRTGSSKRDSLYDIKQIQETFLRSVLLQRGDRLTMTKEDLAQAAIYTGLDGLDLGLVDGIGSTEDAVRRVAGMAHVAHYEVVDINQELNVTFPGFHVSYVNQSLLAPTNTVPVNYYLYMEFEG